MKIQVVALTCCSLLLVGAGCANSTPVSPTPAPTPAPTPVVNQAPPPVVPGTVPEVTTPPPPANTAPTPVTTPPPPAPKPTPVPAPKPAPAPAPAAKSVTISGFSFQPSSLQVVPGTVVTWTNQDAATHIVASDSGAFASGPLATGSIYSHVFTETGTFSYHCSIHPTMQGTIIVK